MKRTIVILLILASLLLIGFGSFISMHSSSSSPEEEDVVISYWTHEDKARTELENDLIASFEKANPHIRIIRRALPSADAVATIPTALAAGHGPDLFDLQMESCGPLISAGLVDPIDYDAIGYADKDALSDAYLPSSLDGVWYYNRIYGLPLEYTSWCLYVNKKQFASIGLDADTDYPRTWEDMLRLCRLFVTHDGEVITRRGFDFRYPYYLTFLVPMAEQLGGKLYDEESGEAMVGKEAWIKVFTFLKTWGPKGENLGSPTYENVRSLFNNGDVAMALSGLYQEGRMKTVNPDFFASDDWAVVPFPRFASASEDLGSAIYIHYYMVNASISEQKKEACWRFASYLLSHPERYLKEAFLVQPRLDLMSSDALKNMRYGEVFLSELEKSKPIYYGAKSQQIQDALSVAVDAVMLDGAAPEKVVATLKGTIEALLSEESE